MNSAAISSFSKVREADFGNILKEGHSKKQGSSPSSSGSRIEHHMPPYSSSDELLMAAVNGGDKNALGILFRRYAALVRAIGRRILRNDPEADDLVQEVFLFIFRRAELFDAERGTARSWIVQVTYHRAIDRRRYLARRHFYDSQELDERSGEAKICLYEESIEGRLGKAAISEIRESLSQDQLRVLELYFFEGFAIHEIVEATGQSIGNVRNHYYRGLEKIRRHVFGAKLKTSAR